MISDSIFPKGDPAPAENFTGNASNKVLVANDTVYNAVVGNVYFEPGARTNWHLHPGGQILVIIHGEGFHQIKGEPKQLLKKSDVVKWSAQCYALAWSERWQGDVANVHRSQYRGRYCELVGTCF